MSEEITLKPEFLPDNVQPFENFYFAPWREKSNNNTSYHIPEENLKQLDLQNYYLVYSNGCSMLHLASSKSQTHYSIALKFSALQLEKTLIETVFFFLIICWSLEIKHSFHIWLNDNSRRDIIADFSKKVRK